MVTSNIYNLFLINGFTNTKFAIYDFLSLLNLNSTLIIVNKTC
jgi:hypothetical protein